MSRPAEQPSPIRVLLVEDYPDLAEVTAEFLKAEGLDVRVAESGGEALEIATAFQPQLLLCDLNLPDISGLDVVRQMRSSPSTERTYAVILTAMGDMTGERLGVDAVIAKPITFEIIRTLVKKVSGVTVFRDDR
jgi:two-component system, sensor histidine kinase and response regulator